MRRKFETDLDFTERRFNRHHKATGIMILVLGIVLLGCMAWIVALFIDAFGKFK